MSTTLIDGKHPKIVIIEYYDDLIAQVDVYTGETMKKVPKDEMIEAKSRDEKAEDVLDSYYQPIQSKIISKTLTVMNISLR
jgi:hypothetical protein